MWNFLAPPAHKQELPAEKIDSAYKSYRWQVFLGIFIGYAGFYIVRKNFSMAIPELADRKSTRLNSSHSSQSRMPSSA